jgi:hypothetical protein
MTSFVSWIGVDSRGPTSLYLASDSRISWGSRGYWDAGRKVFGSRRYPELLGYIGDVLFPSQILGQVLDLIDADVLFAAEDSHEGKWHRIANVIKDSFATYPSSEARAFTIVYATRQESGMLSHFYLAVLSWNPSSGWSEGWIPLPNTSGLITTVGSGAESVDRWYSRWSRTSQAGTSRSVFGAFCDSLVSHEDPLTGGPPQLVGLYRIGAARTIGVIYGDKGNVLGLPVNALGQLRSIECRNSLFERCDWATRQRLDSAQPQNASPGLGREVARNVRKKK